MTAQSPFCARIVEERRHRPLACLGRVEDDRPLEARPAEVDATAAVRHGVDLLARRAPDVGHVQEVRHGIDPGTPRVPEAVCPDLGPRVRDVHEGVVRRHGERVAPAGVDAEDASEEHVESLRERPGLVQHPWVTVADGRVQVAVGAELQHAAVVVLVRLRDREHHALVRRVGAVRLERVASELGDLQVSVRALARVEHRVEEPALGVVGCEGDGEQPGLALVGDPALEVEERQRLDLAVPHDAHRSRLLDDEDVVAVARRGRDEDGLVERPADRSERDEARGVDRGLRRRAAV